MSTATPESPRAERAAPSAYARHIESNQARVPLEQFFRGFDAWYASTLPADRSAPILDFGLGRGDFLRWLSFRGHTELHGFDIIDDYAAAIADETGAEVTVGDDGVAYLRENANRFSAIYMKDVLEHVPPDLALELLAAARVALKPGGSLIVSGPHAASIGGLYTRYEDWTHHSCFTLSSLEYALSKSGLVGIENVALDIPWSWRPRSLVYRVLRRTWFSVLRLIYLIERPGEAAPQHFWPRIVVRATAPGA